MKELILFSLFELDNKKALIESIEILNAIFVDQVWLYLMVALPVTANLSENQKNDIYSLPFTFLILDPIIEHGTFSAKKAVDRKPIKVTPTCDSEYFAAYQQFLIESRQMTKFDKSQLDIFKMGEIVEKEQALLYNSLYKI